MKRISMALFGLALAAGPASAGTAGKAVDTAVKGAETAGTATWNSAKTVGGTTRGAVTGGTSGAKQEAKTGADVTKQKTKQRAADTRDAADAPY